MSHIEWPAILHFVLQGVPLATEPGISLIILTPMKILQRNLNRSTFVVWEMWRPHNIYWKWPPFASRQDWIRRAIFWKVLANSPLSLPEFLRWCSTPLYVNWTMRNSQLDISSRMERHPTLYTPAWPKFSPFSATASFRRDFGHRARPIRRSAAWLFLMGISERESLPE